MNNASAPTRAALIMVQVVLVIFMILAFFMLLVAGVVLIFGWWSLALLAGVWYAAIH